MCENAIDALIEMLADHLGKKAESGKNVAEETKALAELVSARAQIITSPERRNQ